MSFSRRCASLSYLKLENNDGVTAEGIDALQSALPSCQIVHEPKYYTVVFGDQSFRRTPPM